MEESFLQAKHGGLKGNRAAWILNQWEETYDDIGNQCIIDACEQDKNELFRREICWNCRENSISELILLVLRDGKLHLYLRLYFFFEEELWIDCIWPQGYCNSATELQVFADLYAMNWHKCSFPQCDWMVMFYIFGKLQIQQEDAWCHWCLSSSFFMVFGSLVLLRTSILNLHLLQGK